MSPKPEQLSCGVSDEDEDEFDEELECQAFTEKAVEVIDGDTSEPQEPNTLTPPNLHR